MVVYGTKNKKLSGSQIIDKCGNCGTSNVMEMHIFQKFAHVFWIPFFPMKKLGISQCNHCKQVLTQKEMPPALTTTYQTLKAQTKTPIWTFAGIGLVVALVTIGVISDRRKDEKNAKLIVSPQVNDIYEVKLGYKAYTLYKVAIVKGDSIFLRVNDYETNKATGLNDLKKKRGNAFSEDFLPLTKPELKEMLDKGEILDIER